MEVNFQLILHRVEKIEKTPINKSINNKIYDIFVKFIIETIETVKLFFIISYVKSLQK